MSKVELSSASLTRSHNFMNKSKTELVHIYAIYHYQFYRQRFLCFSFFFYLLSIWGRRGELTTPKSPAGQASVAALSSLVLKTSPGSSKTTWGIQNRWWKRKKKSAIPYIPEIKKMPKVLNFEKEYLCARHPGVGFNRPTITPPTRASTKEKKKITWVQH